jgi:hypothetical protein
MTLYPPAGTTAFAGKRARKSVPGLFVIGLHAPPLATEGYVELSER